MENVLQQTLKRMEEINPSENTYEQGLVKTLKGNLQILTNTLIGVKKIRQKEYIVTPGFALLLEGSKFLLRYCPSHVPSLPTDEKHRVLDPFRYYAEKEMQKV